MIYYPQKIIIISIMNEWKKIFLIMLLPLFLTGAGYVGTLPDLGVKDVDIPAPSENAANDILPLDKLTIPTKYKKSVVEETPYVMHHKDTIEMIRLMENLSNNININANNSIKKFVANANMLNLHVKNYNSKYPGDDYYTQRSLLNTINNDTIKMKDYWLYCEKYKNYILNYDTSGEYSQEHLEAVKREYQRYLDQAVLDLKMMD